MNQHSILPYIIIAILVTNLIRILPMALIHGPIKNRFIRSFLYYVPYVTLAVMTFPDMVLTTPTPLPGIAARCLILREGTQKKRTGQTRDLLSFVFCPLHVQYMSSICSVFVQYLFSICSVKSEHILSIYHTHTGQRRERKEKKIRRRRTAWKDEKREA